MLCIRALHATRTSRKKPPTKRAKRSFSTEEFLQKENSPQRLAGDLPFSRRQVQESCSSDTLPHALSQLTRNLTALQEGRILLPPFSRDLSCSHHKHTEICATLHERLMRLWSFQAWRPPAQRPLLKDWYSFSIYCKICSASNVVTSVINGLHPIPHFPARSGQHERDRK